MAALILVDDTDTVAESETEELIYYQEKILATTWAGGLRVTGGGLRLYK